MASKIEWTHQTFNPQVGCNRAAKGCDKCYAIRMAVRQQAQGHPNYSGVVGLNHKRVWDWTGKVTFTPGVLTGGVAKLIYPSLIFVNSMSDTFHREISDEKIKWYVDYIRSQPDHVFQLLTKRSERVAELDLDLPENLWLGVSVCDAADLHKIDDLRRSPAKVKFLSLEPLIGDLGTLDLSDIDWVIVGGESVSDRRMDPDWVRSIRDQCIAARIPLFFKQWGDAFASWTRIEGRRRKVKDEPVIDGKYWLQFPTHHPAVDRKRREIMAAYPRDLLAPYRVRAA